ncbi:hypothetical protein GO491_11760 [Flavobacteriaceae bacterium Ap0902]|nr:hypothetical protein [Flavobacteriaceae bacterium Ap0902]
MDKEFMEVSEAAEQIKKTVDAKIEGLKEGLSKETQDNLDTIKSELIKEVTDKVTEAQKDSSASKDDLEALKKELKETNKSIEDMANKAMENKAGINAVAKKFAEAYKKAEDGNEDNVAKERGYNSVIKMESTDVMSVDTVDAGTFPDGGSTGIIPSNYRALRAQYVEVEETRPYSPIMDVIDLMPLTADQLIMITDRIVGDFEITPECVEKPVVKFNMDEEVVSAEALSAIWFTTLKLRKFFSAILNRFENKLRELLDEKIPNHVLKFVSDNAVAFTPATGLATAIPNATYFDVIASVVGTLKKAGHKPNGVALSPVAYTKMITAKNANQSYQLANGQSIVIVGDKIKYGGQLLDAIEDPMLEDDEFIVGDFNHVKVAVDSELFYLHTDGRVDGNAQVTTGLIKNIRTHELAKFVAVGIGDKSAIVKDTFANSLTLIGLSYDG